MDKVTTLYKYGFYYKEVPYGWKYKKLYKLPYTKNKRSYSLKEIKPLVFKSTIVYNIQKDKLTLNRLKTITKQIDFKIIKIVENEYPF